MFYSIESASPAGVGAGRWRNLPRLRAVLWSCSSAVSTGLGLWRRLGSVVVVGPPYAGKAAFVKQLLEQRAWRRTRYTGGRDDDPLKAGVGGRRLRLVQRISAQ